MKKQKMFKVVYLSKKVTEKETLKLNLYLGIVAKFRL